jgi:hypothetical protein
MVLLKLKKVTIRATINAKAKLNLGVIERFVKSDFIILQPSPCSKKANLQLPYSCVT